MHRLIHEKLLNEKIMENKRVFGCVRKMYELFHIFPREIKFLLRFPSRVFPIIFPKSKHREIHVSSLNDMIHFYHLMHYDSTSE